MPEWAWDMSQVDIDSFLFRSCMFICSSHLRSGYVSTPLPYRLVNAGLSEYTKTTIKKAFNKQKYLEPYNQTNADDQPQNIILEIKFFYQTRTCHCLHPTARSHQSGWDHLQ